MKWRQVVADLGRALGEALNPATSWELLARTEDSAQALMAAQAAEARRRARIRVVLWEWAAPMDRPKLNRILVGIALASDEAERSAPEAEQPQEPRQTAASRPMVRAKRSRDRQAP